MLYTAMVPMALIGVGTLGFHALEELPLFDAMYLTVVTLSTIGYGDITPKTTAGRAFTITLIVSGVFTVFYAATSLIRLVVSGELQQVLGSQQRQRMLSHMHNHVIVCGYGRMGRLVCAEFSKSQVPFVVIDRDPEELREFKLPYGLPLVGDANSDDTLRLAGIDRARGLVTVMPTDSENLFTTMSGRLLNAKILIVARVEDSKSETKLLRAGANRIVSPYQIGGARVAHAVLRPTVMDFIELATRNEHIELQLEETRIATQSSLAGKTIGDSQIGALLKVIVVAVKKPAGTMIFNPASETRLEAGDILVVLGHKEQLGKLDTLADPSA